MSATISSASSWDSCGTSFLRLPPMEAASSSAFSLAETRMARMSSSSGMIRVTAPTSSASRRMPSSSRRRMPSRSDISFCSIWGLSSRSLRARMSSLARAASASASRPMANLRLRSRRAARCTLSKSWSSRLGSSAASSEASSAVSSTTSSASTASSTTSTVSEASTTSSTFSFSFSMYSDISSSFCALGRVHWGPRPGAGDLYFRLGTISTPSGVSCGTLHLSLECRRASVYAPRSHFNRALLVTHTFRIHLGMWLQSADAAGYAK